MSQMYNILQASLVDSQYMMSYGYYVILSGQISV